MLRITGQGIRATLLAAFMLLLMGSVARADSFGLNIYGLSYHINDRDSVGWLRSGGELNEVNLGIGLRASFGSLDSHTHLFVEGGSYKDSFKNQAKYISLGFQYRVVGQLRLGINAAVYTSRSISKGNPIFAPIPIASFTRSNFTFNLIYIPKFRDYTFWHTLGASLTIDFFHRSKSL